MISAVLYVLIYLLTAFAGILLHLPEFVLAYLEDGKLHELYWDFVMGPGKVKPEKPNHKHFAHGQFSYSIAARTVNVLHCNFCYIAW